MRLIIGGAFQGKLKFAAELLHSKPLTRENYADGEEDAWEDALLRPVVYRFHQYIRRSMEDGQGTEELLKQLLGRNPEALVIMDEVGCGVVPISPEEREFRELAGRAGQCLAVRAREVYRVVCGIGMRIK